MLIVPGLILVAFFSIIITKLLGFKNIFSTILSTYIIGMANVILIAEIAGIFNQVNNEWFFLLFHFLLAITALTMWWLKGKPKLFTIKFNPKKFPKWLETIKREPLIWILAFGVISIYILNAIIIVFTHANTNDSLAVHLARIGYWLQFGSFRPWPTENIYQITYPFNAQVQMLWTILLSGTDRLVEFIQWFGAVFGIIAITGTASLLGYSKKQGLFAGLIWATLPMILLQSTTTQNDLITASVILIGIYFLFFGISQENKLHLIMSGLAFGISLGIKQTAFFIIPGLVLSFILFFIKYKSRMWKYTLIFISSTAIAFLLLGSFIYLTNMFAFPDAVISSANDGDRQVQTPFGPSEYVATSMGLHRIDQIKDSYIINSSRYFFQSADLTGIPLRFKNRLSDIRESSARIFFSTLNVPIESDRAVGRHVFSLSYVPIIHEDEAWFGLLGFLLLFLALIETIKAIKPINVYIFAQIFIASSAFIAIIFFRSNWTPYQGRYMVTVFSCLAPFFASIYHKPDSKLKLQRVILIFLIITFAFMSSFNVMWNNAAKPLRSPRAVFFSDRLTHYSFSGGYMVTVVEFVNNHVPPDATLGLAIGRSWEYPYFGEGLTRNLIPIFPQEKIQDNGWLFKHNINYILIDTEKYSANDIPSTYVEIASYDDFLILSVAE